MLIILLLFSCAYLAMQLTFSFLWKKIPQYNIEKAKRGENLFISIIIPARNEIERIAACLDSVRKQDHSKTNYEIIVVDDFSTDGTAELVETEYSDVHLLRLSDFIDENEVLAHKKRAIELAVGKSKGDIILCTDADCQVPEKWLASYQDIFRKSPDIQVIAGPVVFRHKRGLLQNFQALDFMGMMMVTGVMMHYGLGVMANGANLAYRKKAFLEVGGFDDIDQIASGDDILLVEKMKVRFDNGIAFLKSRTATVQTESAETVRGFLQQRIRWGSKTKWYRSRWIQFTLLFVFSLNLLLILSFLWTLLINCSLFFPMLLAVGIKSFGDFVFLYTISDFFKRKHLLWLFLPAQLMHITYIAVAGVLSNLKRYHWKGRNLK